MGQRSQIFVVYKNHSGDTLINATYFQWNYGERMVSRARHTMEWIKAQATEYSLLHYTAYKLRYIESINFDYKDVVVGIDLIEEWKKFKDKLGTSLKDYIFYCDNNDGCLFIDARDEKNLKYAFTTDDIFNSTVMGPVAYLKWNNTPTNIRGLKFNKANVRWITHNAKLMKKKELKELLELPLKTE